MFHFECAICETCDGFFILGRGFQKHPDGVIKFFVRMLLQEIILEHFILRRQSHETVQWVFCLEVFS